MRIIFHIDVNSAYLSWTAVEQLKNGAKTDLRLIPAIIGGDQKTRHGVVLAKSVPAKKYGIHTGEPVANAIRKCPNLTMEPPDHELYRQYSRRLMDFLRTYTDQIEQVSVDECYLDFTGIADRFSSPVAAAFEIKDEVLRRFGFTVNVGISTNKLLAKMASDFEKPNKVHTLFPEEIREKMWPLPIRELYMAGASSVRSLEKLEVRTIGDLARMDPAIVELHLKSHGRKLWEFANGIDDSLVEAEPAEAKGIGNSVTLPRDARTEEEACQVLKKLAASVGRRLRKAGYKAGMVSVEIRYHDFRNFSHQRQLGKASSKDEEIWRTSVELFRELWTGEPVRLLGIRTSKLAEEGEPEQMTLFEFQADQEKEEKRQEDLRKRERLDEALGKIRKKYGENVIQKGILPENDRESR